MKNWQQERLLPPTTACRTGETYNPLEGTNKALKDIINEWINVISTGDFLLRMSNEKNFK